MTAYLDIETIPAPAEHERVLRELFAVRPGRAQDFEDYLRGTSLSGNWGRVLCVGLALDDGPVEMLTGDEPTILRTFWTKVATASLFVGHNALDFDLPFLYKRSIVHRIKPSKQLSFARYRSFPIYDTMREWDNWSNAYTGLDQLARILGLPSPKADGLSGEQIYDAYRAGRLDEIYAYCTRDVETTRAIHLRLTFRETAPAETAEVGGNERG